MGSPGWPLMRALKRALLLVIVVAACAAKGARADAECKSLEEDLTERGLTYFLEGLRVLAERNAPGIEPVLRMVKYSGSQAEGRLGVLAPSNDAFVAASGAIQNTTESFLLHVYYTHILTKDAPLATLAEEGTVTAVNTVPLAVGKGEKDAVTFKAEGGDMTATVTTADISTCAAQLQIVDTVLIVPELNSTAPAATPPLPVAGSPPVAPPPPTGSPEDASQDQPPPETDGAKMTDDDKMGGDEKGDEEEMKKEEDTMGEDEKGNEEEMKKEEDTMGGDEKGNEEEMKKEEDTMGGDEKGDQEETKKEEENSDDEKKEEENSDDEKKEEENSDDEKKDDASTE